MDLSQKKQEDELLQLVTFSIGEEEFGVNILKVQEIIRTMEITKVQDANVVEVAIKRLRAKLDGPFEHKLLHTIRGMGYVLERRSV